MTLDADDIERIGRADFRLFGRQMDALRGLRLAPGSAGGRITKTLCRRLPEELTAAERHKVTLLAWTHRRALPRELRPIINPADPLSPDQAALHLGCTPTVAAARIEMRSL